MAEQIAREAVRHQHAATRCLADRHRLRQVVNDCAQLAALLLALRETPGVRDRDRRVPRQPLDDPLILLGEFAPSFSVR